MRRFIYALLATVLLAVFGLGIGAMHVYSTLQQPLQVDGESQFIVKSGASVSSVARDLENKKLLPSALFLRVYARLTEQTQIKVGEYNITAEDTSLSLLDKLIRGDVIVYQLTLIEGWTFKQALNYLRSVEKLGITLKEDEDVKTFLASLDMQQSSLSRNNPEGWFFPDTYNFSISHTDADILRTAYQRMRNTLATEWESRDANLPYQGAYQALIMASIVEKETGVASEREQIAGVFVRRLQNNMRLQTDPTVIYGLGDDYDGNLRRRHLSQDTPYNTYVIRGLPPTPIALPGREAIYAALHPAEGTSLYFVAKGDGSHQFSDTLEEHNAAVQEYQIRRRNPNYRSVPAATNVEAQENNEGNP